MYHLANYFLTTKITKASNIYFLNFVLFVSFVVKDLFLLLLRRELVHKNWG